jgi:SAM-dependent methyltransferase
MKVLRRLLGLGSKALAAPPAPRLTGELEARIKASFEEAAADEEHFPSTIDARLQHVRLIAEFLAPLGEKRTLDLGSGKGRFARVLAEEDPGYRITCVDVAVNMLRHVTAPARACASTMNALPFAGASFDAAYATEALEHAVDLERAVAELCRVVRPGGRIAIIDKNAEHWGRLETPDWERWFTPGQMEGLLGRHCRRVRSQPIAYWAGETPDGLFYIWFAEK